MTTVVDAHAHVVVPGLGAEVTWRDGAQVVAYQGREIRAALREFVDLDRILEAQDAAGVDVVVLCAWVNLLGHEVGRQNEALAGMVGERVAALGTVDLERPELLVELMEDGRLRGVEIPAAPGGAYLGDARFRDFWAAAAQTGALVFVHPTTRSAAPTTRSTCVSSGRRRSCAASGCRLRTKRRSSAATRCGCSVRRGRLEAPGRACARSAAGRARSRSSSRARRAAAP